MEIIWDWTQPVPKCTVKFQQQSGQETQVINLYYTTYPQVSFASHLLGSFLWPAEQENHQGLVQDGLFPYVGVNKK